MVTKFVAVLLYVWLTSSGQPVVKLDQQSYNTLQECQSKGIETIKTLATNPLFVQGLFAQCLEMPVTQA
jgi:hypothetical protein